MSLHIGPFAKLTSDHGVAHHQTGQSISANIALCGKCLSKRAGRMGKLRAICRFEGKIGQPTGFDPVSR
jgi:hypothetical protein